MNPLTPDTTTVITDALAAPKDNEVTLRGYSEFFEYTNMLYKRLLNYLGNMLSFNYTYYCVNATEEELKSEKYKKDEKILIDFMNKFSLKREFKKVMRMLIRQDAFFCCLRNDMFDQYILQELPIDYCVITGQWEYGFVFDFNMLWFMSQPRSKYRNVSRCV
jgi:hypothetical protein